MVILFASYYPHYAYMPLLSFTAREERLCRLVLDNALDAFIAIDEHGKIIDWSRQAERVFGWSAGEVLDQPLDSTLIPQRFQEKYMAGIQRFLTAAEQQASEQPLEITACRRDGNEIPIELSITPLRHAGQPILSCALRDISYRKKLEQEIQHQARFTQTILDDLPDAVAVADLSGRLILINPAAQRLLHLRPLDECPEQTYRTYELLKPDGMTPYPEEQRPMALALRGEHTTGAIARLRHESPDADVWVSINARPLDDENGAIAGGILVFHDITQQVNTERALRETRENYRLLVETTTDFAIIMTDPDGLITHWNPGAQKILGMSAEEAIGNPLSVLSTPEDHDTGQAIRELDIARESGRAEDVRWHRRKDGSRLWANGMVMPLKNDDGSLRGFVKILRDETKARVEEEQTQFLAMHDMLTGLPNRVHFSNELHHAIAQSDRTRIPLAVLMLDLDRFKYVNDTFGHHIGDLLLKEVGARIAASVRETDVVARLGGDEFIVIQTNAAQPAAAITLAKKLIHALGLPYQLEGNEIISGTSIGISTYPTDAANPVDLVKHADLALYQAKNAGRGNYQRYTVALSEKKDWKKNREQAMRDALENHKFSLYYQPQIDLSNWKIINVEALLRWQPDEMELVLPDDFLDLAEETGFIVKIGEWAMRQACMQVKKWQSVGMENLRIALNCSARQFSDPEFVGSIRPILEETGLKPSYLELEVSESLFSSYPKIKEQLSALRNEGVHITIDNYGTGTVALIDLKEFEVDGLKIDKAFVQHLPHRRKDAAIASAIISLAHELGIHVGAGGVETAEQLAYLKARNCTSAQGFLFSPPMPAEKFEQLMLSGHWSEVNRMAPPNDSMRPRDLH